MFSEAFGSEVYWMLKLRELWKDFTECFNDRWLWHRHRRIGLSWDITQRVVAVSYRRSGTTYFQGSRTWTLKMVPVSWPETSVRNCHHSLRNNPEQRSSPPLRGGSKESHFSTKSCTSVCVRLTTDGSLHATETFSTYCQFLVRSQPSAVTCNEGRHSWNHWDFFHY